MGTGQVGILAAIIIYLAAMVCVGFYFNRKGSGDSVDELYPGGCELGALVTVMSTEASDTSGWLLAGLSGVAYLTGAADAGWTAIGLAAGTYLDWLVVTKRPRRYSAICNTTTIPDPSSWRYRDEKNILMCVVAIVILIFFIPYTASGLKVVGALFNSLLGMNYHIAMVVGAVVIIGYAVLDGFMVVSITDLTQSIVMSTALAIIVFLGTSVARGWEAVADNARSLTGYLGVTHIRNIQDHTSSPYGFITILSTPAWGLGYFGILHILLRFMTISHEDKLEASWRIASVRVVTSMFVAALIGIIGYGASVAGSVPIFASSSESGTVIIRLADLPGRQGVLLSIVVGIVLAETLVYTVSTADSQLLTAASGVSRNLLRDFLKIKVDSKTSMTSARPTVIVIALMGIALAWNSGSSIFTIVSLAWVGFSAFFGPVMLFALFWKCSNPQDALAGMITGGVMVLAWEYGVRPLGGTWNVYGLLPVFLIACTTIMIVPLVTETLCEGICREFDSVGK